MKLFIVIFFLVGLKDSFSSSFHYYAIPSDTNHFHMLKNCIGSIHKNDKENLGEIAVFNLGLSAENLEDLNRMYKVKVYNVEITNLDLLKYFETADNGRLVRGYFAWKPVVIKQSLELFPYVLYMDAGTTVLKPLNDLFNYIQKKGYFIMSCTENENCNLVNRITQPVIKKILDQRSDVFKAFILSGKAYNIDAGLQGVSRKVFEAYVKPVYDYTFDLELFKDDATAFLGYGAGRHDQTLFSIEVYYQNMERFQEGWIDLKFSNLVKKIHIHWDQEKIKDESCIYRSRHDIHFRKGHIQHVIYK